MRVFFSLLLSLGFGAMAVADDHVVIVFDTSGSMADNMQVGSVKKSRISVAQTALIEVLSQLPDSTKVGILTFNGWIYDLGPVDREKMKAAVLKTKPSGGTPLYQFMRDGATRLLKERQANNNVGSYKLLVVTDGIAGDAGLNTDGRFRDGSVKPGVLRDIISRVITVDAIGLDMVKKHPLSAEINGKYMRGDDPKSLASALKNSVAEVGFGSTKDASEDAFKEISELPDSFVNAALKGLTTFHNHPIGEKPPVETPVNNSQVVPVQVQPVAAQNGGSGFAAVGFSVIAVGVILFAMFAIIGSRR